MNLVESHYAQPGLAGRILEALRQNGLDPEHLNQADLARLDQFHVGGLEATDALVRLAEIRAADRVLDLGSGIGGPSRYIAATTGCHVTGLDLAAEYCEVAAMLARATGLAELVNYRQGDALAAPFPDASFDVVWTQHAAMNIEDKPALYREIYRLLGRGGRVAVHDIVAGSGEVRYPVPWASEQSFSFLVTGEEMRNMLRAAGFEEVAFQDVTEAGLEALRKMVATPSGLGLATLMGARFRDMVANLVGNLQSGACRVVRGVYSKP